MEQWLEVLYLAPAAIFRTPEEADSAGASRVRVLPISNPSYLL